MSSPNGGGDKPNENFRPFYFRMEAGNVLSWPHDDAQTVQSENPAVASISLEGDEVTVTALAPGDARLFLFGPARRQRHLARVGGLTPPVTFEGSIMARLKQSTAYNRMLFMGTGLTTPAVALSKNGGAFGAAAGTLTAVGSAGWYNLALTTVDTGTAGDLAYHFSAAGGTPAADPEADQIGLAPLDLTQVIPTSNTGQTVGDALNAARRKGSASGPCPAPR